MRMAATTVLPGADRNLSAAVFRVAGKVALVGDRHEIRWRVIHLPKVFVMDVQFSLLPAINAAMGVTFKDFPLQRPRPAYLIRHD